MPTLIYMAMPMLLIYQAAEGDYEKYGYELVLLYTAS